MILKRLLVSLICVTVLMSTLLLPASALSAAVSINAEYDVLEVGATFEVVVAVNNIIDDAGLVIFESKLFYDFDCFEIVNWVHNKPESWGVDFEDFSTVWNVGDEKYFKCGYLYGGAGNVGVVDDGVLFTTITFKVLSEGADGKTLHLKETEITNDLLESALCNNAAVTINFDNEPAVSQGGINESSVSGDESSSISGAASESSTAVNQSSTDGELSSEDNTASMNNALKIVFAVAVVVLIVAFGIFINQRRKSNK